MILPNIFVALWFVSGFYELVHNTTGPICVCPLLGKEMTRGRGGFIKNDGKHMDMSQDDIREQVG